MGGYAFFVWTSFGISFVVLLANVLITKAQYKSTLKQTAAKAKARNIAKTAEQSVATATNQSAN